MCLSVSVISLLLFIKTTDSVDHGNHINTADAAPTVDFNEIFTNSFSLLADEPTLTTLGKDEDFHLSIPSQFVEFPVRKPETTTTPTPPPPVYLLTSSHLKKQNETEEIQNDTNITTTTPSPLRSSSGQPDEKVKVIPISKGPPERGVLDILFPASRVRTFKGFFDTVRRVLSHTFRKR